MNSSRMALIIVVVLMVARAIGASEGSAPPAARLRRRFCGRHAITLS
ncbi:MAG: hypothetical protein IRY99_10445 [Isosphaeraceae bacterium]|nr:hypothetical protein [Isosphaeraceae bacterium]